MMNIWYDTRSNHTIAYQAEQQAYRFYKSADEAEAQGQTRMAGLFESYGDKAARNAAFHYDLFRTYGR